MIIAPQIVFYGNCSEAVNFYKKIFNLSDVNIVTFGDVQSILNIGIAEKDRNLIYSAELYFSTEFGISSFLLSDSISIIFDDSLNRNKNIKNNISIEISDIDKERIKVLYNKLAKEGKINTKLKSSVYSELHGSIIDKYGICWNFYYGKKF